MPRRIMIRHDQQPGQQQSGHYYVLQSGDISHQDYWQGHPRTLIGFRATPTARTIEIPHAQFWSHPHLAHHRYPVFGRDGDTPYTLDTPIVAVRLADPDIPAGYPDDWITPLGWAETRTADHTAESLHAVHDLPAQPRSVPSWRRRFINVARRDERWSMLTVTYVVSALEPDALTIVRQLDLYVTTDPHEPSYLAHQVSQRLRQQVARVPVHDTDGDIRAADALTREQASQRARELCAEFDLGWITWNGIPFDDSSARPITTPDLSGRRATRR